MFTQGTQNYGLPQWLPQEKPTWLGDMNSAFLAIDTNLKSVSDTAILAQNSATQAQAKIGTIDFSQIASTLSGAVVELADRILNILTKLGDDNIAQLGTSITNAIVNIGANITILTSSVNGILTRLGNVVITEVGTSITDAIVNLFNGIYYTNGTYIISGHLFGVVAISPIQIFGQVVLDKTIPANKTITINNYALTVRNEKGYVKFKNLSTNTYQNLGNITKDVLDASLQSINISIVNGNKIYIVINSSNNFISSDNQNVISNSFGEMQITNINFTIS